jgi:hypothetical protein
MLVVRVELWPGGDSSRAENLGVLLVVNEGHQAGAEPDLYDYKVGFQTRDGKHHPTKHVRHYRRAGWERLVARSLEAVRHHG